jgi:hypothetical protein
LLKNKNGEHNIEVRGTEKAPWKKSSPYLSKKATQAALKLQQLAERLLKQRRE